MNQSILVSVVVTVLNEGRTIEALLTALLNQSYPVNEVIIVDGGSTDQTAVIVRDFQSLFPDFPLLYFTKVGNRSVGRNAAIQKAQTEVIAITDAGCIPHSDWLEQLMVTYLEAGMPLVAGYYDAAPRTTLELAEVPYVLVMPDKVDPKTFLPATRSMLLEKEVWSRVGEFDEKLADNEDFAFAQQLKKHHVPIAFSRGAQVTWQPRSTLIAFLHMIYRFAKGDSIAGIWRPKVLAIFLRYLLALIVFSYLFGIGQFYFALNILIVGIILYSYWAIRKNIQYARKGWYWLPILQITSDISIMVGSIIGGFKKLSSLI